jgi:GTPase SAR1 family protein
MDPQMTPSREPRREDALSGYRRRKLELADMVRTVMHHARERRDEPTTRRVQSLLARLAEDRFQLAVVGQFSRGKTTLMNAIMGGAFLPTGVLPTTSVITTVRYGSRSNVVIHREGSWLPIETSLSDLARYVAESSPDRERLRVSSAEVEVPAEILRLGFTFVDTPGIGSAVAANTATTRAFLPEADAVIFVTSADSPLTDDELRFLTEVRGSVRRLFFVVNKIDLVPEGELDAVLRFVHGQLHQRLDGAVPTLFPISAKEGLEAKLRGDSEGLSTSGLPRLEAALTAFLTVGKSREFLFQVARRADELLAGQKHDLLLSQRLRARGGVDAERLGVFDAKIEELLEDGRRVVEAWRRDGRAALVRALEERWATWREDLAAPLAPRVERICGEELQGGGMFGSALDRACSRIEAEGRALLGGWLERCAQDARQLLLLQAEGPIGRLLALSSSVDAVGMEAFGVSDFERPATPEQWPDSELPSFLTSAVEWSLAPRIPWWSYGVPLSWSRRGARRRLDDALARALSACRDELVRALASAADMWMETLRTQAEIATKEAAARFRSKVAVPDGGAALASVEDLERRLQAFASALVAEEAREERDESEPALRSGQGPGFVPPSAAAGCVVCRRLEASLFDYLREDQFELATDTRRQESHAEGRGFCPLHTWDYAELASSIGISAAYARLAEAAAHALRAIEERSSSVEDLRRGVAWLTQGPEGCPACRVLAAAERSAIAELIADSAAMDEEPPPLCVIHLQAALDACSDLARARRLARALSEVLERASEDMRTYALKRESLRAGMVTDEERRAYLLTLQYLAGHANLARPRRVLSE